MNANHRLFAVATVLCLFAACAQTSQNQRPTARPAGSGREVAAVTPPTDAVVRPPPGPPSDVVTRGLTWLAEHQLPSGGWGQGDESTEMGGGAPLRDVANVADTCMAGLALIRSGSTPSRGPYRESVRRAAEFVLSSVEHSDNDSMLVTDVQGTRVQMKIGQYVDTFASLNFLNELRNEMPNAHEEQRLRTALARVVHKIERNQGEDGTWAQQGWAPTLSQSLAARGLNREARAGATVSPRVLRRVEQHARDRFDGHARGFRPASGDAAGVDMYDAAGATSTLHESAETAAHKNGKQAVEGSDIAQQAAAAEEALVARLHDPQFVQGFGSNGGEEFLSYMLISETLAATGGARWQEWSRSITGLLEGVQNGDGSWSGHHCITGRTFCTASAILVLLADRAPSARG
jgi:hypothetical protein